MKINRSTTHDFALACSLHMRAGKFKRVGEDFLAEMEAELEAIIRRIDPGAEPDRMPAIPEASFIVQSEVLPSIIEKLNSAIAKVIARKVYRQPTVGQTLRGLNS